MWSYVRDLFRRVTRETEPTPEAAVDAAAAIERVDAAAIALAELLAPGDAALVNAVAAAIASAGAPSLPRDPDEVIRRKRIGAEALEAGLEERDLQYVIDWRDFPDDVLAVFRKLASRALGDRALWTLAEEERWTELEPPWTPALVDLLVSRAEKLGIKLVNMSAASDTFTLAAVAPSVHEQVCELATVEDVWENPEYAHGSFGEPPDGTYLP